MKQLIIIPLVLLAIQLSGQRNYTQMQIDSIDSGDWAAEGDLYYNTDNGYLYIGLITGKLYLLLNNDTDTDEQDLGSSEPTDSTRDITITNGSGTVININDLDSDPNNEIQNITSTDGSVSITSLTNDGFNLSVTDSDDQDLGSSVTNDSIRAITITDGTGTSININDLDADPDNEIQNITSSDGSVTITPLTDDGFNLSVSTADDHLGTDDQALTENRTVAMSGRSLTFDGTQDVIIEADGDVGIGTAAPGARLDVDNGTVRFSDYGVGSVLDTLTGTSMDHPHSEFHLGVMANGDVVEVNTVKSSKIFYPPSMVIDVSMVSSNLASPGDEMINLYNEYVARFGMPALYSPSGPDNIPVYDQSELYYYITDLDTDVFSNFELTDDGIFTYDVKMVPPGNCTWINVVFVVK